MLEFSAAKYLKISHELGSLIANIKQQIVSGVPSKEPVRLNEHMNGIMVDVASLGLSVTAHQIGTMLLEFVTEHPEKARLENGMIYLSDANINLSRLSHHLECIYSTLLSEMGSSKFRVIPREKNIYVDEKWLFESPIYFEFPNAWKEIQSAGRCYAYGENTACAFHVNRAMEWGLKSLAVKLERRFDRNSWEKHLQDIEKELKTRYTAAGARSSEEKFFSETAAHFSNMKVAFRNPTMHVEAKYDEKEALYLLINVEQFIAHLAKNGLKEAIREQDRI